MNQHSSCAEICRDGNMNGRAKLPLSLSFSLPLSLSLVLLMMIMMMLVLDSCRWHYALGAPRHLHLISPQSATM